MLREFFSDSVACAVLGLAVLSICANPTTTLNVTHASAPCHLETNISPSEATFNELICYPNGEPA